MRKMVARMVSAAALFGIFMNTGALEARGAEIQQERVMTQSWMEAAEMRSRAADISINQQEMDVLYLTNKIRMINGLEPLSTFARIQAAADIRGSELGTKFDHERPDGTLCFTALDQQGISYQSAAENISAGSPDAMATIDGWWNSPGHQANMMASESSHLGVGYDYISGSEYGHYWVQLFTGTCAPTEIRVMDDENYIYLIPAGTSLEYLGLMLEADCEHGTAYLPILDEMCTGYNPEQAGTIQTVQAEYGGRTASFQIYPYPPMQFTDVSAGDWYYGYVEYVYALNIMTGLNDTYFGAVEPLSRAQFAVILYRLEGEPDVSGLAAAGFPDVPEGIWYDNAVRWAAANGIISGYTSGSEAGKFGASDKITRAQMATMMYRYAKYKNYDTSADGNLDSFPDVSDVPEFAVDGMKWAVGMGIITGDQENLNPQGSASRAVGATIITRFMQG